MNSFSRGNEFFTKKTHLDVTLITGGGTFDSASTDAQAELSPLVLLPSMIISSGFLL